MSATPQMAVYRQPLGGALRVIGIVNQKGGCGKTTTAINLGAWLAQKEKKVLLIDMDPQGHATAGLNAQSVSGEIDMRSALLNVYEEPISLPQLAGSLAPNLDLVPSLISLVAIEQELAGAADRDRRLRDLLHRGGAAYDYILIDSPPNLGMLTVNVLAASREILIPVDTGVFSLHGLRRLFQVIELVQERMGLHPRVQILMTMYDQRVCLARTVLAELEQHYPGRLLQTKIRNNVHLKEAPARGLPILQHKPNCLGSWDYRALADEIVAAEAEWELDVPQEEVVPEKAPREDAAEGSAQGDLGARSGLGAQSDSSEILFCMAAPQAASVRLVGEFNEWQADSGVPLKRGEDGVWTGRIRLPPGNYQYKYLVDGQWVVDPGNPLRVVTDKGAVNSLVKVR
ncbi:MAG: AAA family ATPase [bacterium]